MPNQWAVIRKIGFFFVIPILTISPVFAAPSMKMADTLDGIWIAQRYMEVVTSSRSVAQQFPRILTISSKKRRLGFQNRGAWKIIEFDGSTLKLGDDSGKSNVMTRVNITLANNGKVQGFRFVDKPFSYGNDYFIPLPATSVAKFFNKFLLEGKYIDSQGASYTFGDALVANWPNRSFSYGISFELMSSGCDNFYVSGGTRTETFYFKRNADELQLFEPIHAEMGDVSNCEEPFVVLKNRNDEDE